MDDDWKDGARKKILKAAGLVIDVQKVAVKEQGDDAELSVALALLLTTAKGLGQ